MTTNWKQEQQSIYNDLSEEGVMFTFTRPGKGVFDPTCGEYAPADDLVFQLPGIEKIYNSNVHYAQSWAAQTTVEMGDKVLMLACGNTPIQMSDTVMVGGAAWVVMAYTPLSPGSVDLLQFVLIRKQ